MNFAQSVKNHYDSYNTNTKLTENGAVAYSTLGNPVLDLFSTIGALRPRSENEIAKKFAAAYNANAILATKMLFYCGDIRNIGLGERRTFRICLKWLASYHPDVVVKNLGLIPYFNRWDSIFQLIDTPCEDEMWNLISAQLKEDAIEMQNHKSISLLAKWMPSQNASSQATRALGVKAGNKLGLTPRNYRKMLSKMRKYLRIVERDMSANNWDAIKYDTVPSYAMKNYSAAFRCHDANRFQEYLNRVKSGEKKINASTLFPYNLVHKVWHKPDEVTELQWKSLPNYVEGENNFIVMADVSGSMYGRPIETSIGLATYFAQHNKGDYHNLYMTFTDNPHFITLNDNDSLYKTVEKVLNTDVGYSTNLEAAFNEVLNHARQHKISPNDMPKAIIVISDMEIDPYFRHPEKLNFVQAMRLRFAKYGYALPKLVLFNVESRQDTFLTYEEDTLFVSGQSTLTFKQLCTNLSGKTAYDLMLETLNNPCYDCVNV